MPTNTVLFGSHSHAQSRFSKRWILGTRVDATNYSDAVRLILEWARKRESRYVCVATTHMIMEGYDEPRFQRIVNGADMVTSDGMPLVWGLRLLGVRSATRVYGPDLMLSLLASAAEQRIPVGLYGGRPEVLTSLRLVLSSRFTGLQVPFAESPPYCLLAPEEDDACVARINDSQARVLFVGLGCPKQERWMAEHATRLHAVMVGVGAAFDFLTYAKPRAPAWMQRAGLEWFFRLCTEPRRLWRRYLILGSRFVVLFILQLVGLVCRTGESS